MTRLQQLLRRLTRHGGEIAADRLDIQIDYRAIEQPERAPLLQNL